MIVQKNPYSFEAFIQKRDGYDFYRDDSFLQKLIQKYAPDEWETLDKKLLEFSPKVSLRWRQMSEEIARPQLHPYLLHYNGYNERIDRIVRPAQTELLEKEIFGEGLFTAQTTPWERFVKQYLLHQLGEAGVLCPIACTEGLIALIEHFPDHGYPELDFILRHCREGIDGDFGIGAQFMTEIQGGSDIPANLLEAVPEGRYFRLYGNKFFCSAAHADYAVVTAKIRGSEKVSTFIVPLWLPLGKPRKKRNAYYINRLKWKLGTCELPTAEIDFEGSLAYPVGPPNRGVAVAVGIVLTLSRLAVGIASAAYMTRAVREASLYSEFREAFGSKIKQFSLVAHQLNQLTRTAQRTLAGAFKVYNLFVSLGCKLQAGLAKENEPPALRKQKFQLRELILLQKITAAQETVDVLRRAISIFGGHGVIEDFSSLPRLFRDAVVNELWEGPRNVLLTQIYRDLARAAGWYNPDEFVADLLRGAPADKVKELSAKLKQFLSRPFFNDLTTEGMQTAAEWDFFCSELFNTYQEQALVEVERGISK
ncbi:acyl-CoA dehydrogenase family protein [Desulfovirgula thermocuniculi]|uniref:acyl-CoA dehydrogenase family protein n=1 Tax=Desulfovirgula thermocuniculi TaxID=348842 RepID=UPI00041E18E4|nr:acyl-CoA dehydrogenase family protein [Desulfovirgula thermocuniculi]